MKSGGQSVPIGYNFSTKAQKKTMGETAEDGSGFISLPELQRACLKRCHRGPRGPRPNGPNGPNGATFEWDGPWLGVSTYGQFLWENDGFSWEHIYQPLITGHFHGENDVPI